MHRWKDEAECLNMDTNIFFDKYEEDQHLASSVDHICQRCPVNKNCFAWGVSNKEWGVWGGVYLENGEISREFNKHKTKELWGKTWTALTLD